ncbi:MAG: uracil-DNA glycosylase family protein [Acidobacteriota bacterium]
MPATPFPAAVPHADPSGRDSAMLLAGIRKEMGDCQRCGLCEGRRQIVFGIGSPEARLMFIGEAPGQEEDRQGEPFVGRAGKLLDQMIASIGFRRQDVYIANIVKCRPPRNRNPQSQEIEACQGFLIAQIEAIRPEVIVTLGKFAVSTLLGEEVAITRARGQLRLYRNIPLMPTFHPAYLLRQYTQKNRRAVYNDLLQVREMLAKPGAH